MKRFLSIIGVSVLSLSLLVGCGGSDDNTAVTTEAEATTEEATTSADSNTGSNADDSAMEEEAKQAMLDYVSAAKAVYTNIDKLNDADKKQLQDVSMEFVQSISSSSNDPAAMVKSISDIAEKVKAIADSNSITVDPVKEEDLQSALAEIQAASANVQSAMSGTDANTEATTAAQ